MKNIPNLIKWTGTKRKLSSYIVAYFPQHIDTFYEPFIGSGAVLRLLLEQKRANHYIASDLCEPLIQLWKYVRDYPNTVCADYELLFEALQRNPENYYQFRNYFNSVSQSPGLFLFLLRTCVNGIARFNRQGKFNSSLHLSRPGINPGKMREIIFDWSAKIQNVEFICQDYREIKPSRNDFCYFDPPYSSGNSLYLGNFNSNDFFDFLKDIKCPCAFTYNGLRGEQAIINLPSNLYDRQISLPAFQSSFSKIFCKKKVPVSEQLYLVGNF